MLETLRNAGKSWIAKVLMIFLAASFGIWGIQDVFRGFQSGALATVGDREISAAEYSQSLRQTLQSIARSTGQSLSQEDARKAGYDKAVLDDLIRRAAIDAQADSLGLVISPQSVVEAAQTNPAFQGTGGQFDPAAFAGALQANGLTEAGYMAVESQNLRRQSVLKAVGSNFQMPTTLVEALSKFKSEQRDARYFTIQAAVTDVAAPSDSEIKEQYEKTPAAYTAPEYRSIAVLKVEPSDLISKISITDDEVKAGYERLKAELSKPERRTFLQIGFPTEIEAEKARTRLAGGLDFIALANERGLKEGDYLLADKAKDELLDKDVANAAFSLQEGATSDVVKGSLVTALLKVTKITPGHVPTLDEVRGQVTERLQLEKAREQMQAIFDTVENERNNQTKLEDIAKSQNLPFVLIPAVSAAGLDKDGKEVNVVDKPELLKAAYASDVGDVTSPLNPTDSYIWYDVREVIPSALKPLDAVKAQVQSDVTARKVRELLRQRAEKIVASLKSGLNFDQVAQQEKAELKQAQGLTQKRGYRRVRHPFNNRPVRHPREWLWLVA